jgi:DNA-binding beta-propeller fold protein YncE
MKRIATTLALATVLVLSLTSAATAAEKTKAKDTEPDPYAEYVWPPPPDEARIKLEAVISSRADVEAKSKLRKLLIGASPQEIYDQLKKPHAVEFDSSGRILVTDWGTASILRFDREERKMDVLGTRGAMRLKQPLGLDVGPDDTIYVADIGLKRVVAFDSDGKLVSAFGRDGDLLNPTDAAVAPDGKRLFVVDSKAHKIVVFDLESGDLVESFGGPGQADGEFAFPSALAFDPEGNVLVVDQINGRVQLFDGSGEYLDQFGGLGTGFGSFARPKDIAVDANGLIYVTDNAFNNVQLFDTDFTLLTFVGEGGRGPGRFHGASGVAARGERFAVVDQLGRRVQVFRFLQSGTD